MTRSPLRALTAAAVLVLALYLAGDAVPGVYMLTAPLRWLATFAHETGHGLTALAVGGHFDRLVIFADGSGVATSSGVGCGAPEAAVATGGLVGPALVAALFFAFGTRPRFGRIGLALFGIAMLAVAGLFVRDAFGLAFSVGMGALMIVAAGRLSAAGAQTALLFLALQLSLSVFSDRDYLFTAVAHTGRGDMPSDVAVVATALGGPYWAWGVVIGAVSVGVLAFGLGILWVAQRLHGWQSRRALR